MMNFLHPSFLYAVDTLVILCLFGGIFLLTLSWWRTHGRLARFLRRLMEVFGLLLLWRMLLFIGVGNAPYWPYIEMILIGLAALIFLLSQTTLFAIIRSLSTEYRK